MPSASRDFPLARGRRRIQLTPRPRRPPTLMRRHRARTACLATPLGWRTTGTECPALTPQWPYAAVKGSPGAYTARPASAARDSPRGGDSSRCAAVPGYAPAGITTSVSSRLTPRPTTWSEPLARGRCRALASFQGATVAVKILRPGLPPNQARLLALEAELQQECLHK